MKQKLWEICQERKDSVNPRVTNQTLAELSGKSETSVAQFLRGEITDPSVYTVGPICKVFGISLDEYFDIASGVPSPDTKLLSRIHELESENHALQLQLVELSGSLDMANAEVEHQKETTAMLQTQLANRRPVIYTLMCSCAVMAFTLLIYLVLDFRVSDVGFIINGNLQPAAWVVLCMIVAAVAIITWSIIHNMKQQKKGKE